MFTLVLMASAAVVAGPAEPAVKSRQNAVELVRLLGDPSFKIREKASDDLLELGSHALEALREGIKHSDLEISDRCSKLLPMALDARVQEQIAIFLAKADGPIPKDLPCINRWVAVAGSGKNSREMYAELIKHHRKALLELELHPDKATDQYHAFSQGVSNRQRGRAIAERKEIVSYPELVLFLFMGADPNARKGKESVVSYSHSSLFLNSTYVPGMLAGVGANEATKSLFIAWLEQERYPTLVRRGYGLAATAGLKEVAPIVVRYASDKKLTPSYRAMALASSLKLFDKTTIKELEPLLKDDTLVSKSTVNGTTASTEIRDIALGISIVVTGQKPSDYGYSRYREDAPAGTATSYTYFALTDKQREDAIAKWNEHLEKSAK